MKPTLVNARFGHACNSSSTHSILLMDEGHSTTTDISDSYGWDYWTAADTESKDQWVMLGFWNAFRGAVGETAARHLMKAEFDWSAPGEGNWDHVDHQSEVSPIAKYGTPDESTIGYVKAWRKMVANPNVVIVGGNDNDDSDHHLAHSAVAEVGYDRERGLIGSSRFRVDGDMLTTYNQKTGARLSMAFGEDVEPRAPMLADVKITDYCTMGCEFCYQASTEDGKHGELRDIEAVAARLGQGECFEVAIGGGEPTSHPQFWKAVQAFRKAGMNVNITSRNIGFWTDTGNKYKASQDITAVAASVETVATMRAWLEAWPFRFNPRDDNRGPVLTFQVIDGLVSPEVLAEMDSMCRDAGVRITMLGYKVTGFGLNVMPEHTGAWVDVWKSERRWANSWAGVSAVDTVIARYLDQLDLDVHRVSVIETEGVWSKYFDCVGGVQVGPSSYEPEEMTAWV